MRFMKGDKVQYQKKHNGRWKVAKVLEVRDDCYVIADGFVHILPEDRLRRVKEKD